MTNVLLATLATSAVALPGTVRQAAAPHTANMQSVKVDIENVPDVIKPATSDGNDLAHTVQETLHSLVEENELGGEETNTFIKSLSDAADMYVRLQDEHKGNPHMILMKGMAEMLRNAGPG